MRIARAIEDAFYVWDPTELKSVLGEAQGEALCRYFGVTSQGNFEGKKSVLSIAEPSEKLTEDDTIRTGKKRLLEARNKRIRPSTDDKIITGWNGFMIPAFALAYQVVHAQQSYCMLPIGRYGARSPCSGTADKRQCRSTVIPRCISVKTTPASVQSLSSKS